MEAMKKGIDIILKPSPDDQVIVKADPMRLKQVLTNLVGNAMKFTNSGSITISATPTPDNTMVEFSIKDTGIGIHPKDLSKLFTPFVQGDGTSKRKHGGTGLGLAICKSLIEMMDGKIAIASEGEGKGTTVSFTLLRQ